MVIIAPPPPMTNRVKTIKKLAIQIYYYQGELSVLCTVYRLRIKIDTNPESGHGWEVSCPRILRRRCAMLEWWRDGVVGCLLLNRRNGSGQTVLEGVVVQCGDMT